MNKTDIKDVILKLLENHPTNYQYACGLKGHDWVLVAKFHPHGNPKWLQFKCLDCGFEYSREGDRLSLSESKLVAPHVSEKDQK